MKMKYQWNRLYPDTSMKAYGTMQPDSTKNKLILNLLTGGDLSKVEDIKEPKVNQVQQTNSRSK